MQLPEIVVTHQFFMYTHSKLVLFHTGLIVENQISYIVRQHLLISIFYYTADFFRGAFFMFKEISRNH
jgi:hypothetical protein